MADQTKGDQAEVLSVKPDPIQVKETTRQAMSSIMSELGLDEKGEDNDNSGKGTPGPDKSGDPAGGLDPKVSEEGKSDPPGDPGEQRQEVDPEAAGEEAVVDPDEASVEGVDEEINLLEELNAMAGALQAQKTGMPEKDEPEAPAEPEAPQQAAPFKPTVDIELSDEDFNKALSGAEGFKNAISKAVEQGVASSQQSMLQSLSMAIGKVVAETVERAVEFSSVKARHPIVSKYPDAFAYAATEVQAANPEWSRDKILSYAVQRLKLYEKAKSRQADGEVIDTDKRPTAAPVGGASVRQKVGDPNAPTVNDERNALIAHIEEKDKRRKAIIGA